MNKSLKTALLTVAAAALAPIANAAEFANGDLLLGFRANGGAGATSTYVYNLGPATTYRDAGGNITLPDNIGTDLASIFGADWHSRADLHWGIVGVRSSSPFGPVVNGDPVRTIYASKAEPSFGTQSEPWVISGQTDRGSAANSIATFQNAFAGATATGNSGNRGAIIPTSQPNDWTEFNPPQENVSFEAFNPTVEATFANGADKNALDLFRILNTSEGASPGGTVGQGTYEGSFSISRNGAITFSVTPPTPQPALLLNIATRLRVQSGENVLIGGFIITGNGPKRVLIRSIGPSLAGGNPPVPDALQNPALELYQGESVLQSNDDWRSTQEAEIQATGIPPSDDRESALIAELNPGSYTAIVSGKDNTEGIGLVEVYDLNQGASSFLANIATRGFVDTGANVMIGGFIAGGSTSPVRVIIRAIGPSLNDQGVTNALQNPFLELFDGNGNPIRDNDNWRDDQEADIQATGVQPTNDAESAIVATLPAGNYTAIVSGVDNSTGVGLVEVYRLAP